MRLPLPSLRRLAAWAPGLLLMAGLAAPARGADTLGCRLAVPDHPVLGQPVPLTLTLANHGPAALAFLRWKTPFEQRWTGPFVSVLRDGVPLAYQGPMVKRGDPDAAQYVRLAPGESRSASLDLALPFDLTQAGRYEVRPDVVLADVLAEGQGTVPRTRDALQAVALRCNPVTFELRAR
jgi:hypothetical protein